MFSYHKLPVQTLLFLSLLMVSLVSLPSLSFALQNMAISPVPPSPKEDKAKQALGKKLYEDTLFSSDHTLSCMHCHDLKKGGTDHLPRYIGINKKEGLVNTPTILNASLNYLQFWNAAANSLEAVLDAHVKDETIFANHWDTIVGRVQKNSDYSKDFIKTEWKEINETTIKKALISYINSLVTPEAPFDRYLKGETSALTPSAQKGYKLFQDYGCISCHQGPNMGGNIILPLGIYKSFFVEREKITSADLGYFTVTGKEKNKFEFKVPSLRNIALTGPYLHTGEVKTLEEIVSIMGIYQVGQPIPTHEIAYIVEFLESLTGVLPKHIETEK